MSSDAAKYPIVGIGASAGGIPALEGFFKGLESDCGAAFVVVTHLSPDRESLLHEVVGRYTEMPVVVARDGARVEPSTVYVLPQNAILSIEDGRLQIRTPNALSRERKPIDIFFSALARDQGEYAVGIVLSGGDSGGTLGIKERELRDTREQLQSTIEEYETALEELKSSNEELVSVNEESQSTNEELEASKEEMQSLNEELNTINAELNNKVAELDHANSDLKNLFESTEIASVFLDRNLVIRNFTPAASTFFKLLPADVGRPLTDLSSHLDYPNLKKHIRKVFETGEMIEHSIARDGEGRHYLVRLNPYRDGDNRIEGVVVTFVDVTTLAEAEEHQKVLIAELNHRVKNMLTVVITIAQQTLRQAPDPEAFTQALIGRLNGMARAYALLSEESWTRLAVDDLVREQMEPFGLERISTEGADVSLKPEKGLALGMVLHELVTNAVKYGALASPEGHVAVKWSVSRDQRFQLEWLESGGPRISDPEEKGFGLKLLHGEVEYQLGGKVTTDFQPSGLTVKLEFPLD